MKRLSIPLILLALTAAPAWAATDAAAALITQARDAQSKGEVQLALRLAQSAIVADPARPGSYVALGDLYAAQGQAEFARSFYEQALTIDPADRTALQAVARLEANARAAANTP